MALHWKALEICGMLFLLCFLVDESVGKKCYFGTSQRKKVVYYYPNFPTHIPASECDIKKADIVLLRNDTTNSWTLETLPSDLFDGTHVREIYFNSAGLRFLYHRTFQSIKRSLQKIFMDWNLFEACPFSAFVGLYVTTN